MIGQRGFKPPQPCAPLLATPSVFVAQMGNVAFELPLQFGEGQLERFAQLGRVVRARKCGAWQSQPELGSIQPATAASFQRRTQPHKLRGKVRQMPLEVTVDETLNQAC